MKTRKRIQVLLFIVFEIILFQIISCKKDDNNDDDNNPSSGTVTDIDGNVYQTVTIGTQVWMKENLKVTKYRNGDPIPNVTDGLEWSNLSTGAYCDYENNPGNSATYGRLYNWYAVNDSRNIAPTGWHVPSNEEWTILTDYLGGEGIAGGKLKETGTTHWYGAFGSTNEIGFTALPGGCRGSDSSGIFIYIGKDGYWWCSTESSTGWAWLRTMHYSDSKIEKYTFNKEDGFSVRCIKD
jgi:uncharacterized protein (TIGR02145 family)